MTREEWDFRFGACSTIANIMTAFGIIFGGASAINTYQEQASAEAGRKEKELKHSTINLTCDSTKYIFGTFHCYWFMRQNYVRATDSQRGSQFLINSHHWCAIVQFEEITHELGWDNHQSS
jgi:hypothetical protein